MMTWEKSGGYDLKHDFFYNWRNTDEDQESGDNNSSSREAEP